MKNYLISNFLSQIILRGIASVLPNAITVDDISIIPMGKRDKSLHLNVLHQIVVMRNIQIMLAMNLLKL